MHVLWRRYGLGFTIGFIFGTLGIFALALLSLLFPLAEQLSVPFMIPGRLIARIFAGTSATSWTVLLLYLLTGAFYGFAVSVIQYARRQSRLASLRGFQ